MLNNQKALAFIELVFIVFTTNSVNLRRYDDSIGSYEMFFYSISLISCLLLILLYSVCILRKIPVFDKKVRLTYLIVNFAILIFYLSKLKIYNDSFFVFTVFLVGIKSIVFSFYFFYIKKKNNI